MMRLLCFLVVAWVLTCSFAAAGSDLKTTAAPSFDLRIRQEILDGVFHFLPDPDRNQLRFRTRAGLTINRSLHTFKLLLANEHRRYIHPGGIDFDWNEIIFDQL